DGSAYTSAAGSSNPPPQSRLSRNSKISLPRSAHSCASDAKSPPASTFPVIACSPPGKRGAPIRGATIPAQCRPSAAISARPSPACASSNRDTAASVAAAMKEWHSMTDLELKIFSGADMAEWPLKTQRQSFDERMAESIATLEPVDVRGEPLDDIWWRGR